MGKLSVGTADYHGWTKN